jgi:hypoxanthine phosphoribosyltransferase
MLRYLIQGWTDDRLKILIRGLRLPSHLAFEKLLSGATPFSEDEFAIVARATGVSEHTFRELEKEFTDWCGGLSRWRDRSDAVLRSYNIQRIFSASEILRRVGALALEMSNLVGEDLVLVPILKGAFIFSADLIRFLFALGIDPVVEFIEIKSYTDRYTKQESFRVQKGISEEVVAGKVVLIVDDICDTGLTMSYVRDQALRCGATKALTCVLIDKQERRDAALLELRCDYVGFKIPRGWVVGYGMDEERGRLRGSSDVGQLHAL